jgi:hypothetical protein
MPVNDFTFYWTAARQLLAGQNPYAPGSPNGFVMLAPPWTFPITLGFGALPLEVAQFLWLAISVFALAISATWLFELYSEGQRPLVIGLLIATFSPVLVMFLLGQIVPLALLGLAGFLRHEPKRPYLAGAFLFLASLKPQIVFLVWPALLMHGLFQARWKMLAGLIGTLTPATLLTVAIRPSVFREYWWLLRSREVGSYQSSTLATSMSKALGFGGTQYLPMILALVWLVWRWKTLSERWEWRTQLPGLLAVSIATTPYAWFSDQVVLLPAVLDAEGRLCRTSLSLIPHAVLYLLVNLLGLVLVAFRKSLWYAWVPFVWLVFYWSVLRSAKASEPFHG